MGQDRTMQHVESTLSGDDIVEDAANLDDFGRTMRSAQDVEQPEISRAAPAEPRHALSNGRPSAYNGRSASVIDIGINGRFQLQSAHSLGTHGDHLNYSAEERLLMDNLEDLTNLQSRNSSLEVVASCGKSRLASDLGSVVSASFPLSPSSSFGSNIAPLASDLFRHGSPIKCSSSSSMGNEQGSVSGHERSLSTGLSQIKSSLNSSGGSNQAATRLKSVTFSAISIESLEPMSFCQVSSLGSEETPVDIRSFLAEPYLGSGLQLPARCSSVPRGGEQEHTSQAGLIGNDITPPIESAQTFRLEPQSLDKETEPSINSIKGFDLQHIALDHTWKQDADAHMTPVQLALPDSSSQEDSDPFKSTSTPEKDVKDDAPFLSHLHINVRTEVPNSQQSTWTSSENHLDRSKSDRIGSKVSRRPVDRWDLDSPRWKDASCTPVYMNMRASSEQKRAYRQTAMEAAKAEQLAALEAAHRRLVAFERSNALYNKTGVEAGSRTLSMLTQWSQVGTQKQNGKLARSRSSQSKGGSNSGRSSLKRFWSTRANLQANAQVFKVETAGPTSKDSSGLSMNAVDDLDDSKSMLGVVWQGKKSVEVVKRPVPKITDPHDAIIRVTASAICGSDLHLYYGVMPGMQKGDQLGHEFMGIVEEVGSEVKNIKRGDRVVEAFDIACGSCSFCNEKLFSECDNTNPSADQEKLYGDRIAAFHGYSHLTGGVSGGQAQFARCHHADVNLLKVPEHLTDMQVILLSDILPTAWHATEMGQVGKGDVVAIWGAGPVGILAAMCAYYRGASRVIMIDNVPFRLEFSQQKVPGIETIDFGQHKDVYKRLRELVPEGPHVSIEAVGFHYTKSLSSSIEMAVGLQTDPSDMINEMIVSTRKGGRISIVGIYAGFTNHFNIGALMEKNLGLRGGQCPVQKYWHFLLERIEKGELKPWEVITHKLPLSQAKEGYRLFDVKEDNCVKVVLLPQE